MGLMNKHFLLLFQTKVEYIGWCLETLPQFLFLCIFWNYHFHCKFYSLLDFSGQRSPVYEQWRSFRHIFHQSDWLLCFLNDWEGLESRFEHFVSSNSCVWFTKWMIWLCRDDTLYQLAEWVNNRKIYSLTHINMVLNISACPQFMYITEGIKKQVHK